MVYSLLAIISGTLITFSLAPFEFWPLAIVAAGLLFYCLEGRNSAAAFGIGWLFGAGLFGSGSSWVYVSVHDFGYTSAPLALFLTFLFCGGLAMLTGVTCMLYAKLAQGRGDKKKATPMMYRLLLFSALWVLGEWTRTWLLSGFPWLFVGYSQATAPLASWAPIIGVYGLSFILVMSGATLASLVVQLKNRTRTKVLQRHTVFAIALVLVFWCAPLALKDIQWTQRYGNAIAVSFVQANISQHDKWTPQRLQPTLALYETMTQQAFKQGSDLVIWPEAAIPTYYQYANDFLDRIENQARPLDAALITGIPTRDTYSDSVYNSVIAFGNGSGVYHKQRLVPFGEYVPMSNLLGNLMAFFELPASSMKSGSKDQQALSIHNWTARPLVCYEIVYPALAAEAAELSDVLITISNDSWFGASLGPLQHLQMAQMRALETGRYVLRGTGNGVSAIIDEHGNIVTRSEQFQQQLLTGEFYLTANNTPWVSGGSTLVPALLMLAVVGAGFQIYRQSA